MEWDARRLIESEVGRRSLFKSRESLAPEYTPSALPHRDSELRALASYFKSLLENPGSMHQSILVTGGVGTGKTTLVRVFVKNLVEIAGERGVSLDYAYVNCYRNRTLYSVISEISLQQGIPVPVRGLSPMEVMDLVLSRLEEEDKHLLLILDDFHYFASMAGREDLYFLARIYESRDAARRLNTILVSTDTGVARFMDPVTESYLSRHVVKLNPYTSKQLLDILRYRASQALREDSYSDEVLELIADYEGVDRGGEGNARHALTVLLTAGDIAEREGADRLSAEHVRRAIAGLSRELVRITDLVGYLALHEQLLLLSIVRLLRRRNTSAVGIGEVEEEYRMLCSLYNEIPRKHTQLYEYVRSLTRAGVISTTVKSLGNRGRTTMISLHYGPLEKLEQYLSEQISRKIAGGRQGGPRRV
ncbi:MAG: ORC1-type DNA replication protein [Desulfurococcus sp.]|nr:ORC1-type DNA replication protein [Desulfurococcus sp.]